METSQNPEMISCDCQLSSYEINGKIFEPKNEKSFETTGVLPLHTYTVKLGFKELLNKEQIGNSKPFPPICQFT